jgi:hypothetical protein
VYEVTIALFAGDLEELGMTNGERSEALADLRGRIERLRGSL